MDRSKHVIDNVKGVNYKLLNYLLNYNIVLGNIIGCFNCHVVCYATKSASQFGCLTFPSFMAFQKILTILCNRPAINIKFFQSTA